MKLKKTLLLVLCITIISAMFCSISSVSAAGTPTVTCTADKTTYNPGDTVTITAKVTNNPGICYLLMTPKTQTGLTYVSCENGSVLPQLTSGINFLWDQVGNSTTDSKTNDTLITLKYKVDANAATGNYSFEFANVGAYNSDEQDVAFTVVKATFAVETAVKDGFVNEDGTWKKYNKGSLDGFTGLAQVTDQSWRYFNGGVEDKTFTGMVDYEGSSYYVQQGKIVWGVNGLKQINGTWYNLSNSKLVKSTTLVLAGGTWYYVENGVINWKCNTLCKYNDTWFYVKNGTVDWTSNTLVLFNGSWFHVNKGKVDWSTTLCLYGGTWYYCKSGKVDWNSNTLCLYGGTWYHVNKGKVDWSTTLCLYGGTWYYCKSGKVDWNSNTLCKYNNTWFYVNKGQVDWKSNTLVLFNGTWFHVDKGQVDWKSTTLVLFGGTWYYCKSGQVDWNSNTLCLYNGSWFHVNKGKVDWSTTLCLYNGKWFYCKSGKVDFTYTGSVSYGGKNYNVVKGIVQ